MSPKHSFGTERLAELEFSVGWHAQNLPDPEGTAVRLRLCSFQRICCFSNSQTVSGSGDRKVMTLQPGRAKSFNKLLLHLIYLID